MAIRITCPGCKTSLTLDDDKRGRKVRCDNCEKVLNIPAANGSKRKTQEEAAMQTERKLKGNTVPAPDEDEEQEEEVRPVKKKKKGKKAKKGASPILLIVAAAAAIILLLGGGGSAYYFLRTDPAAAKAREQAKLDDKAKKDAAGGGPGAKIDDKDKKNEPGGIRLIPKIEDGSPTKKGGKDIIQNIRGAVYRTERKSELKQLALTFNQFCDEYKGGARTKENFLIHIKTFGPIHDALKDGYYQMNMKARLDGDNIIAYERDEDAQGHLCVRSNGVQDYVPAAQLKKELGLP